MKTVKLWCAAGQHEWERASQRGRRPASCPKHLRLEAPEGAIRTEPTAPAVPDELKPFLGEDDGTEAGRKLHYIALQLQSGRRESADVEMMLSTAKQILKRR